jgi:DNA-binding CsgD family transcriptional regulator
MTPEPDYWTTAAAVCTEKELAALELTHAGLGEWRAAVTLGISRRALRDRITNAERKIRAHLIAKETTA